MPQIERLGRIMDSTSVLVLSCGRCERVIVWSRMRAIRAFGDVACPFEVRRRAVCGKCGLGDRVHVGVEDGRRL